jgi:sugar/nucleoside kinase (ribokinase family)
MSVRGLFVGLTTLDLIYGVSQLPQANHKQVATEMAIAAGGPATNAAVAFRHLGNQAVLMSALGQHPINDLIRADLAAQQIELWDLLPNRTEPPPLSSITVTPHNGNRVVVSRNAINLQANPIAPNCLKDVDIVLVDGHQLGVSVAIAQAAQQQNIPVVLDGGSWKPQLETLLPFVDYAVCSADFFPPNCPTPSATIAYLTDAMLTPKRSGMNQPHLAITQGDQPILYVHQGEICKLPVPRIQPIDTLGAGDIFHGAFCHWILQRAFVDALQQASEVAALACQSFGTRQWIQTGSSLPPL